MRRVAAVTTVAAALAIGVTGPASGGGGRAVVKANNYDFVPQKISVPVGGKVVWKEVEGDDHTVTARNGSFDRNFDAGNVKRTFDDSGTWKYYCETHQTEKMKGKVVVG